MIVLMYTIYVAYISEIMSQFTSTRKLKGNDSLISIAD